MGSILLISGERLSRRSALRSRVLRFTGSRRATRAIMARIEAAQRLGHLMSCMILPAQAADTEQADDAGWDVRISYATMNHTPSSGS